MPDSDSSGVPRLPWWATALDGLACALVLLAVATAVTGTGPHGQIAGLRLSLTSPLRPALAALLLIVLRHLAVRRPTLLGRLRPAWAATRGATWPWQTSRPADVPFEPFGRSRARWLWPIFVVLLFCVPLFVGLGGTDFENDEAGYSYSVETILRTGDWLTPKLCPSADAPLDKPPLKCWLVAAPIRAGLLPDNEFGLRIWDALFGAVAFLYVFAIGRMLGGPLCGLVAVLALFLHQPLVFEHGLRTNNMEAPLLLAYCGGTYHFLAWYRSEEGRRADVIAVGLYFVLGFMTKFVAAIFLPAVLGATVVITGGVPKFWRDRHTWLRAGLVAFGLIAPWFVYESLHLGAGFWKMMVGQTVVTRFTSYLDPEHVKPWNFYAVAIFGHLRDAQMTTLARAGLALLLLRAIRGRSEPVLLLLWLVLPLGLMSLGTSKLYHYTYAFLPPLGLAAGYACAVVFGFGWSLASRQWPLVRTAVAAASQRAIRSPIVRAALIALAVAAFAVGVVTYARGAVRVSVGNMAFENWTLLRPALAAMLLVVLAGRLNVALRLATVVLILSMLPSPLLYRHELARLPEQRHQMRTARDCLQTISASRGTRDGRGPGIWVDHEALTHTLYYYLRDLGPWLKPDSPSDALVYANLYTPGKLRPVLLSNVRFAQFASRASEAASAVSEPATDPVQPAVAAGRDPVGVVRLDNAVLLLPGPYRACATEMLPAPR